MAQALAHRVLELGEGQLDAGRLEFLAERAEHLAGGHVDVGHRLGGHDDPLDVAGARQLVDVLAEQLGVGEEDRRVESVEHEARDQARLRVALGVVVALEVVDASEQRVVGAPRSAHEAQQRQADRDPDAPQHAQHGDADERRHGEDELRGPPLQQPPARRRCR